MPQRESFRKYIDPFDRQLGSVVIDAVSPEAYCKKYLGHLLQHKKFYLHIYADVLDKLLQHSTQKKEDIILIDFGAGNGMLGIFAKYCGFKKVFLNDIDKKFVEASTNLAAQLHVEIDDYIHGDIRAVQTAVGNDRPDAIVGTDVIEHIYDVESFFMTLKQINPSIVSVLTTASNPSNYFKVRQLEKIQLKDELEGGTPADHLLFGEAPHEPFLKIREQIIRKYDGQIPGNIIASLAKATRGLNENDIRSAIEKYKQSGQMPVPAAGHNTCNPVSGSWTERILSLENYISLYRNAGFTCKFYAGFYNEYGQGKGFFVKKLLNRFITIFGQRISPYIVLVGYKNT